LKAVLKDKDTWEKLDGYAYLLTGTSKGSLSMDENYSCIEQTLSERMTIYAYAKGYAPRTLPFEPVRGQMTEVRIPMTKSCSGGPSCFDNIRTEYYNQTRAEEEEKNAQELLRELIKEKYGLEENEYKLTCAECDLSRGGFIKAKGTYMDATPLELYYHWGWCSSGGADCGWDACFTSKNKELFSSVKKGICLSLSSYNRTEDTSVPGVVSMQILTDDTNETIRQCLEGKYETRQEDAQTISVRQDANRYETSVANRERKCGA
jgi:hypothetical protein